MDISVICFSAQSPHKKTTIQTTKSLKKPGLPPAPFGFWAIPPAMSKFKKPTGAITALALLLFAGLPSSQAANIIWTGGAGTANWSDAANWSGANTPPIVGDVPIFGTVGAGGATLNMNLTSPNTNFLGLTFAVGAPSFTLNGGTINSTGGIVGN